MSAKNLDRHNRFRSITVGFRVSPEEQEQLNRAVALSGLPKQEYCYRKCMDRTITVQPNPRVYKALKDSLAEVLEELKSADPDMGALWEDLMLYWDGISTRSRISYERLPDGLPDDDSLCLVVLGFQLLANGESGCDSLSDDVVRVVERIKAYRCNFLYVHLAVSQCAFVHAHVHNFAP